MVTPSSPALQGDIHLAYHFFTQGDIHLAYHFFTPGSEECLDLGMLRAASNLSILRQKLRRKLSEVDALLKPALHRDPVLPGALHVSRHRCGKESCRCANGELYEARKLQIRFKDGLANRCVSKEQQEFWLPRAEAYKRLRDAQRSFRRWHKEVLEILQSIERARHSHEGLDEKDRKRPFR